MGNYDHKIAARLLVPVLFGLFVACSPRVVENVRTEYVYRDRVQIDTTWLRDSVYVREWVRGDTVRIVEYRDHLVYQYKMLRDTAFLRDSVTIETVRTVEVARPLSAGQKAKIQAFWWLVLAVAGFAAWTFRKPLAGLITKVLKLIF